MWDAAGNSSWSYDQYGRVTTATRVVDGRSYASDYTFDSLDRVREMTYPDNETLTYSYQANLLLDGISSSIGDLDLVSDVVYEDIGLPDSYTLGSGANTATQSFEYWKIDDLSRSPFAAIKRIKLSKGETDLVNREMQYDAAGNVTKIVDGVNSETIDYTYDDLDRLLTASVPAGESYAYNTIGNVTSKSGATLDYGTTSPKHGVKTYGSASYTYDANGSMTAKGDLSIKYDPEHRPVRVQDSGTIYRVVYDGDGVRRKRLDESGTIHYLGHYERNVGNGSDTTEVVTKYYYGTFGPMSRLIAFRRAGELYWAGADHLGGTIRVMDSSFAAVDGMRYEPYGEDRDTGSSLNTDRKFTGQTEDQSIGLYWYASRAYDPDTGRFCSPDPIVPAPGYPPALNRYSYVYNNPLKFIDPSGHSAEWFNQKWVEDFIGDHGHEPTGLDIAYRYASMDATSRGQDWSVEHWASQLPPVPAAPEGVDINANILYTESTLMLGLVSSVPGNPLSLLTPYADWFNRIREGGKWDYKRINLEKFEEFGNFNFGATGAALGIPEEVLLKGAASVQILDLRASGEGNFSLLPGGGVAPYGDERKDAAAIKAGIAYYHAHRARRAIQFTEDALSVVKGAYSGIRSLFTPSR